MAALVPPRILGLYVTAVAWGTLITPALNALSQVLFPMILEQADSNR